MTDKKLWNRADVRAEMNRIVKEATDACKKLHDVAGRIAALGADTNFIDDAQTALEALRKRVVIESVMVIDSIGKLSPADAAKITAGGKPVHSIGEVLKDIRCARGSGFYLTPASRLPGVWRDYGCTCSIAMYNVSGRTVWHLEGCQARLSDVSQETWGARCCLCGAPFGPTQTRKRGLGAR